MGPIERQGVLLERGHPVGKSVAVSAGIDSRSEYEALFGTRHRRSGRPGGGDDVVFPADGVDPIIQRLSARRATAVVLERNKSELARLYAIERRVLEERGLLQVAADAGIAVDASRLSAEGK